MKKTSLHKTNYSLLYVSNAVRKRTGPDTCWVTIMGWQGFEQSRYHVSHCHRRSVSHWWLGPYEARNNAQLLSTTSKLKTTARVHVMPGLKKFSITFSFNDSKRSRILQCILLDLCVQSPCAFILQNWVTGKPEMVGWGQVGPSTCKVPGLSEARDSILSSECDTA